MRKPGRATEHRLPRRPLPKHDLTPQPDPFGSAASMAGVGAWALAAHGPSDRPTRLTQSSEGGGESVLDRIVNEARQRSAST